MADTNGEIIELKIINSLLMKELRKSKSTFGEDSNYETIEITQLKQLNSLLVKELKESRTEIQKLKLENEILKSEQSSQNATKNFQSSDDQKNCKRKKPNSSSNAFKTTFSKPTSKNDFENEDINVEKVQEKFIENKLISNTFDKELFKKNESLTDQPETYCNLCETSFHDEKDLKLHYSTIHQGNNVSRENKKETQNQEKIFIENVHDKNQRKIMCHICTQTFSEQSSKRKHLKTQHDIDTHFSCDVCKKTFSTSSNLKIHKKAHIKNTNADSKKACDICGKILSQKHLKNHMKDLHLDLFKCKECDINFTRVELNRHIGSVHRSRQNIVI